MPSRPFEVRERALDAAESAPATTWLEAAEALLNHQAAPYREQLYGSPLDRGEARRHLKAILKLRVALRNEDSIPKKKVAYVLSDDRLVRRMRRADLLCPKGWREGIRAKLVAVSEKQEEKYLAGESILDDQDIVDAQEFKAFIAELDHVFNRGESARREYARREMKVVNA